MNAPAALPEAHPCRSCGAPVIWTITSSGRRMPVDASPHAQGNVHLDNDPAGGPPLARYNDPAGGPRFLSHFATCPNASTWRRR